GVARLLPGAFGRALRLAPDLRPLPGAVVPDHLYFQVVGISSGQGPLHRSLKGRPVLLGEKTRHVLKFSHRVAGADSHQPVALLRPSDFVPSHVPAPAAQAGNALGSSQLLGRGLGSASRLAAPTAQQNDGYRRNQKRRRPQETAAIGYMEAPCRLEKEVVDEQEREKRGQQAGTQSSLQRYQDDGRIEGDVSQPEADQPKKM